jgi:hypothetical protein
MRLQALADLGRPLGNWLLGLFCAALLAVFLSRRFGGAKGPNDADDRVRLGTLTIKPLLPLIHSTIPRTDLAQMRAHPERISPHGRRAGE